MSCGQDNTIRNRVADRSVRTTVARFDIFSCVFFFC